MIRQLFSILKDAIYRRTHQIAPEGKNLHRKRKRGATERCKSAEMNMKKRSAFRNFYMRRKISIFPPSPFLCLSFPHFPRRDVPCRAFIRRSLAPNRNETKDYIHQKEIYFVRRKKSETDKREDITLDRSYGKFPNVHLTFHSFFYHPMRGATHQTDKRREIKRDGTR